MARSTSNRSWGQWGLYRGTKRIVPRAPSQDEARIHGPCIELKDMDINKGHELVQYYQDKYRDVKGRLGTVTPFNKMFTAYLHQHSGTWRGGK